MKGPHFFSLHETFEDLYNENNEYFDLIRAQDKDIWMLQAFLGKTAGEDLED